VEWVKTTAKTLPEAIDLALDNLGVDESEAEIVVLEEPRQGLFGRMRGTARVEARVKPKPTRPKTERNRNRRNRSEGKGGGDRNRNRSRNRGGKGGGQGQGGNRNRQQSDADGGSGQGGKGRGRNQDRGQGQGRSDRGGRNDRSDRNEDQGQGRGRQDDQAQQKSSGRGGERGQGGRGGGRQGSKGRNDEHAQDTKPKEDSPVEEVAEHLETFLKDLTEAFGFDSSVSVDSSEADVLVGQIEGQHGLLVGPKGRTLDAVQELARISCQRTVPSSVRIKVDVGGYRAKRVEALQQFAHRAADSAVEGQVEVALEPMSPADRKAIHDALSEDDRVETRSVGAEPRRKVLVVPVLAPQDEDDSVNGSADDHDDHSGDDDHGDAHDDGADMVDADEER
jgi:spoIIIJ-associated protein